MPEHTFTYWIGLNSDSIVGMSYVLMIIFVLFSMVEDQLRFLLQFVIILLICFPIWFVNVAWWAFRLCFGYLCFTCSLIFVGGSKGVAYDGYHDH